MIDDEIATAGMGEDKPHGAFLWLDPRTTMFYVLTVGCFCLTLVGGDGAVMMAVRRVLALSPCFLLVASRRMRAAMAYLLAVAGCYVCAIWLLPVVDGALGWVVYATIGILTQMLPGLMAAYWMLSSTSVSELTTALGRMRVPLSVTVPLSVMFRFFPVAVAEHHAINEAMSMRGVRWGGGKASKMIEYRVVPLMASSIRMADELAQAGLTRGLGAGRGRTSVARTGFGLLDAMMWALCLTGYVLWGLAALGVL